MEEVPTTVYNDTPHGVFAGYTVRETVYSTHGKKRTRVQREELLTETRRFQTVLGVQMTFADTPETHDKLQIVQDQLLRMSAQSSRITVSLLGEVYQEIDKQDPSFAFLPKMVDAMLSAAEAATRTHHTRFVSTNNRKEMAEKLDVSQPASVDSSLLTTPQQSTSSTRSVSDAFLPQGGAEPAPRQISRFGLQSPKVDQSEIITGRLLMRLNAWEKIGGKSIITTGAVWSWRSPESPKILQSLPPALSFTGTQAMIQEYEALLKEEIWIGAVSRIQPDQAKLILPTFLVKKRGGHFRKVINATRLNNQIVAEHFKTENIQTSFDLISGGDWLTTMDIHSAYLHVQLSLPLRPFLCFRFRREIFQFNALPFLLQSHIRSLNSRPEKQSRNWRSWGLSSQRTRVA
ncbi:hypothetical protein BLNAU_16642 [Blattamonas nauphoetae]|uniref:Reverse transcriptase domain-containing protein n=1 Tax=Blattamonas nauphoetae TaxID=2049346 RepID=A0ABQ9XCV0_9EUKA|nr:hypothetical protein BLNAU_16642 [Blattamonas nauphoetae]